MATRKDIIESARAMLDTPFKHQGRTPGTALDCLGVPWCAATENGINLPDKHGYSRNPKPIVLLRGLSQNLDPIPVKKARPGDVVLMVYDDDPTHIGLLAENDGVLTVIHGSNKMMKVVEHRLSSNWKSIIVRAYQIPGVTD